ncbi:response regulator [Marinibacterium profundimaris]|uniref:response regulator n=1 Tax=Marinibacterium profundimaris TaxID=1679460 RepID=UPI000B520D4B|nr:response regulator [Marinibacterium profundimaris]
MTANRVLLIDDDEMVRELLALRLDTKGYETVQAPDGKAGLARLREEAFDVVVLDLLMPEMDGLAFLSAVQGLEGAVPPILVLSAARAEQVKLSDTDGLHVETLRKPASAGVILAAVEKILKGP